jgi:two-component system phosphate regulon response regulator PhoB
LINFALHVIYFFEYYFLKSAFMANPLILIIEDEESIKEMVKLSLEMAGFDTVAANSTTQAETQLNTTLPDLILVDWMLPGQSGVDYIKRLRNRATTRHIPIILLTAKAEEENKIKGLDSGADDYVTKPFSPRELITRIKTVLRRGPLMDMAGIIKIANLSLNTHTRQASVEDKVIPLTPKTYKLLHFFMRHQDRIYSREQLLNHIWGGESDVTDRTVDVHIRRLRKALEKYQCDHLVQTIFGVGYKFSE